ncbi:hypothetical protein LKL35_30655 [Streptomyces sp. ET3-23]|uniref:hypothetical protein n=1 Tax=Streptomyces sp. ET3-23 TaxID=2885643 RepID=UPI001D0FB240|nr:hypothetical protein [Streptomyces sp. ET3-23]MCC2279756.1 hypothetical protein [Streptomyces sp. ET3-23]
MPPPSSSEPPRPSVPPLPPPPPLPPYAPGAHPAASAPPSPAALFVRRTFGAGWAGSAGAALGPAALLLVLALALSVPSYGKYDRGQFGHWSDRFQAALALLVQGLGGSLDVETRSSGGLLSLLVRGHGSLSVWPLTVTVLWAGAVALGARRLRRAQGGGPEAAVRIALLSGAAVLALGLYGRPEVPLLSVDSGPVTAALFACAAAGAVSGTVLCRERLRARLGPGALRLARAWGTALRALGLSVALCAVVVFAVLATHERQAGGGTGLLASLLVLVNLGLMGLGLAWGAAVEGSVTTRGREEGGAFGLSELGHAAGSAGGWAQAGALSVGAVSALLLAVLAARRSADRREQALAGVFFLAALWLLSFAAGASLHMSAGTRFALGAHTSVDARVATNAGELLLFGTLWTAGAVLLAGVLSGTLGRAVRPARMPVPGRRTALFAAAGLAAFVVGGAAAAGLVLHRHENAARGAETARHDDKRVVIGPSDDTASPSDEPAPTTPPVTAAPQAGAPAGYVMQHDPLGFSLAVPDRWIRTESGDHQIDYSAPTGGSYLRVGLLLKSRQSAYDHFADLEKALQQRTGSYRRVALTANSFQGHPGARWEFTWTDRATGRTMHAVDQAYVNEAGTEYAVYFQGRDDYWTGSPQVFETALGTWSTMPVDFG